MRTALVIEDDVNLNNAISAILEHHGWKVLQAFTGHQATVYSGRDMPIDLVIADVVLSSGNGATPARQLIADRPDIACVLTSGYALSDLYKRGLLTPDILTVNRIEFLEKAFTASALMELIGCMTRNIAVWKPTT